MYITQLKAPGPCILQLDREQSGTFTIYARIPGMEWIILRSWTEYSARTSELISLDEINKGMEVRIESEAPITAAKVLAFDGTTTETTIIQQDTLTLGGQPFMVDAQNELRV